MNWILLVVIAVVFDALVIFIDNYVSDVYFKEKDAVAQKLFYGYVYLIFAAVAFLIVGVDFSLAEPWVYVSFVVAGLLSSIAGIPYYHALELDDSTNLGIFIQLAPVLYLVLGWFWLGQTFDPLQFVAFAVILAAPILIIFTTRKKSRKVRLKAVLFAFLYILISVVGNLLFVKENTRVPELNFVSEMILLFLGKGIANLMIVYLVPRWRKRYRAVMKSSKRKVMRPLAAGSVLVLVKDFAYRLALTLAPSVAIASAASDSAEPIVIFFMGIILTAIWPKFGREKMDRKTVLVHLAATVLVVVGIVMMQNFS